VSDWSGDQGFSVSLVRGYFGPFTFDAYEGMRCRGDVDGHPALISEGFLGTGQTYVAVWVPTLRLGGPEHHEAFVVVRAPRQEDWPVLRTIASSLRVTP
jgi:hypothetical protein